MNRYRSLFGPLLLAGALLLVSASTALAQSESYQARFEQFTSNCEKAPNPALNTLKRGVVKITRNDNQVEVALPKLSLLTGTYREGGKIKADLRTSDAQARNVHYRISGRADGRSLKLLFIAEVSDDSDGQNRPVCTQMLQITGNKQ